MKQTLESRIQQAQWVCRDCGDKYGKPVTLRSTWHRGNCQVCYKFREVTEIRDFNYLHK